MIANRHGRTSLSLSLLPGVSPRFFVGFLTTTRRRDLDRRSAREKKKRASSTSSRLLRGVFLRNVAVSSRIVGRISRISTVYPLPREFVVLFYPRPSRKRCITRRFLFFLPIPRTQGRCRNRRLRCRTHGVAISRDLDHDLSLRSPSSRSLFSFLSLVFSLAPPSLEARRAENRRGTAFKSAGRLSRDVLGGGAARTNR